MKTNRKGIILAGGLGTRLNPLTIAINKHLLPIYNKPMIYYPLSVLINIGIEEILIITNKKDINLFKLLLGNGSNFGAKIKYKIQDKPDGIASAYKISKNFLGRSKSVLILGDNIFHGSKLIDIFRRANNSEESTIFTYEVNEPEKYGVFLNKNKERIIVEKPKKFLSKKAVVGIYFFNNKAQKIVNRLSKSNRGELEITDLNNIFLKMKSTKVKHLDKGIAWLDTGSFDGLMNASNYVMTLEKRQGKGILILNNKQKKSND